MRTMSINTKGAVSEYEGEVTLEFMQGIVGGNIEAYRDPTDDRSITFWVNEDGIGLGLPLNYVASIAAGTELRGDVLVTEMNRMGTDVASLPREYFREIGFLKLLISSGHLPTEPEGGESS